MTTATKTYTLDGSILAACSCAGPAPAGWAMIPTAVAVRRSWPITATTDRFGSFVRLYRRNLRGAWHLGVRHGAFCLGCCRALMLVMFGRGEQAMP
jgi:predicted metal-binding membrane protein